MFTVDRIEVTVSLILAPGIINIIFGFQLPTLVHTLIALLSLD